MAAEQLSNTSSGVQDLIARIRDQGVQSGRQEADRLVEEARQQADDMLQKARAEIEALRSATETKLQTDKTAALEALKLAARDSGLQLEAAMVAAFERQVKRLVAQVTMDGEFLRTLVLVLAGSSADQFIKDKKIQILVSELALGKEPAPELHRRAGKVALAISSEMLREGVELIPASDIDGGVRVRVVDDKLEIDLTSEAISKLLLKYLTPRFRGILSGAE